MIKKFHQVRSAKGDTRGFSPWQQPEMKKYLMACCDCGLVHEMKFRILEDRVQYKARRAERYTLQERKKEHVYAS